MRHLKFLFAALTLCVLLIPGAGFAAGNSGGDGHHISYAYDADGNAIDNWRNKEAGDAYVLDNIGQHLFNLLIFIAILVYVGKRSLTDSLKNRATNIKNELIEAAKLRDEAKAEYEQFTVRLEKFEEEVQRLLGSTEAEAAAESAMLQKRAKEAAERIRENTERNIREETKMAQLTLRNEAVSLAVQLAEQTIKSRVKSSDQQRLAKELLNSLNEVNHG